MPVDQDLRAFRFTTLPFLCFALGSISTLQQHHGNIEDDCKEGQHDPILYSLKSHAPLRNMRSPIVFAFKSYYIIGLQVWPCRSIHGHLGLRVLFPYDAGGPEFSYDSERALARAPTVATIKRQARCLTDWRNAFSKVSERCGSATAVFSSFQAVGGTVPRVLAQLTNGRSVVTVLCAFLP